MNHLQQLFNAFLGIPVGRQAVQTRPYSVHATDWSQFDCPAYLRRQALTVAFCQSRYSDRRKR